MKTLKLTRTQTYFIDVPACERCNAPSESSKDPHSVPSEWGVLRIGEQTVVFCPECTRNVLENR